MAYIADTGVINGLVNGTIRVEDLPSDHPIIAPRALIETIKITTADKALRSQLLLKFQVHRPMHVSAGTVMLNGSDQDDVGFAQWDGALFKRLKDGLRDLGDTTSSVRDILLAEVAISNGLVLLTVEKCLAEVVCTCGGEALLFLGS